jgi:hypothetical protein
MTAQNDQSLQGTTRERLLAEYAADNAQIARASTRPYKSRLPFRLRATNPIPNAAPSTGFFAVLQAGDSQDFFGFGLQAPNIAWTPTFNKKITLADTNQTSGHNTNGVEDFCIESMSHSLGGVRVEYDPTQQAASFPAGSLITDADVVAAFLGQREIVDPGSLLAPPQLTSPFNLEVPIHRAVRSNMSVNYLWDNKNQIQIGTLDQLPEGAGQSYLAANGTPEVANRYKIPEGYAWRAKSRTDGDFVVRVKVEDTVVVPCSTVSLMNAVPAVTPVPNALYLDFIVRVHGVGFTMIGSNA